VDGNIIEVEALYKEFETSRNVQRYFIVEDFIFSYAGKAHGVFVNKYVPGLS
jgi:hypothetical protein